MNGFVRKSLLTAAVLLVTYDLVIPRLVPKWKTWQSTGQTNVINAQRYLYDGVAYKALLLGSSLTTKLPDDSLPAGFCNLSLGGQGVQDGLVVVAQRAQVPKLVALEMNFIFRPENRNFQNSLISPVFYHLREYVPAMRDEYQPIGVLKGWASAHAEAKRINMPPAPLEPAVHDALYPKMIALQEEAFKLVPRNTEVDSIMSRLKGLTDKLEAQGSRIVMYEMPIDTALVQRPYPIAVRAAFERYYPRAHYAYIPMPDPSRFRTSDALHLDRPSAAKYTVYLRDALLELL